VGTNCDAKGGGGTAWGIPLRVGAKDPEARTK